MRTTEREQSLPHYLPARMLNEFVYCPRLFYYEWVEGVFQESADTVEGALRHEKLGEREEDLPGPEEVAETETGRARSVMLSSDEDRLIAKIDLVEVRDGRVVPVDYKKGAPRDTEDGPVPWPADRSQILAQALILAANGFECTEGVLYYHRTKQRVRVPVTEESLDEIRSLVRKAFATALGRIPAPLVDSPKCPRCSLVGICLPDETLAIDEVEDGGVTAGGTVEQLELFVGDGFPAGVAREVRRPPEVRRLVPAGDDLRPLYLSTQGFTVGKSGRVLQIREKGKLVQEARIGEISQVNLFGNVQVSSQAVHGLCRADKPIAYFSQGGWFYGLTSGIGLRNVFLRQEQFRRAEDPFFCLMVSREIVASKIRNQRTLLRRNHVDPPKRALRELRKMADRAAEALNLDELLGIEGNAARVYFGEFGGMIKVTNGEEVPRAFRFDFTKRTRRPPRDAVNALLSLGYSLLTKDLTIVCGTVGFDPFLGYYHQLRFGRPALALDLMEPFRSLIAESAVISAINNRMVTSDELVSAGDAVALSPKGRKGFFQSYEQRMSALVTHPLYGYRVSYRRLLEIQTRLLARFITGEVNRYVPFETR